MRWGMLTATLGALLVGCGSTTAVQPPPAASLDELVERADAAGRAHRWAEALTHWQAVEQAGSRADRAGVAGNVALCLLRLDRPAEALDALERARRYLRSDPQPPEADPRGRMAWLDAKVAEIEARVGRVRITCSRSDAEVHIGARPAQVCPATAWVDPGAHRVEARVPGTALAGDEAFVAVAGATTMVEVQLSDRSWSAVWWAAGAVVTAALIGVAVVALDEESAAPLLVIEE